MTPKDLVGEITTLYSLPNVVANTVIVMESPYSTHEDLIEVLKYDPNITAMILHLANSVLYGYAGAIETLKKAVIIIGQKAILELVIAISVVKIFNNLANDKFDMVTYWYDSVICSIFAKLIARKAKILDSDSLFIIGLLHSIGQLVFVVKKPDIYTKVLERVNLDKIDLLVAEKEEFGFTQNDLGAELLSVWGLSERIQYVVKHHSDINDIKKYSDEIVTLYLAKELTKNIIPYLKNKEKIEIDFEKINFALVLLGLDADDISEIKSNVVKSSYDVIKILNIK